jgi:hypothetical protein
MKSTQESKTFDAYIIFKEGPRIKEEASESRQARVQQAKAQRLVATHKNTNS